MAETDPTSVKAAREARASRVALEGTKAREDYAVALEARDQNTARLKALRLERERLDAEAKAAAAPPPVKGKGKVRATKAKAAPKG